MKTFVAIMQIFPALIAAIKALDIAFPHSGLGKIKLDILQKTMQIAYDDISSIWPKIESIVAMFVGKSKDADKKVADDTPAVVPDPPQ